VSSSMNFLLAGFETGRRPWSGIRVCIVEPGLTNSTEGAMKLEDIAAAILFVVSLPSRANVSEILISPTIDVMPM
jgi:hypothetical protein